MASVATLSSSFIEQADTLRARRDGDVVPNVPTLARVALHTRLRVGLQGVRQACDT